MSELLADGPAARVFARLCDIQRAMELERIPKIDVSLR